MAANYSFCSIVVNKLVKLFMNTYHSSSVYVARLVLLLALIISSVGYIPGLASTNQDETVDNSSRKIYLPVVNRSELQTAPSVPPPGPPPGEIARNEKFEMFFNVQTSAANLNLPFDPNPPPGLKAGLGVTVDVLFSSNNWQTTLVQPAFFYQPYEHSVQGSKDHFVPNDRPRWAVRFTPQQTGTWQYRIRVQDADGIRYTPAMNESAPSFSVSTESNNPNIRRGFLNVSPTDRRYFEFQDGTPFVGMGFNEGFETTAKVAQKMTSFKANKLNFIRTWMSGAGINGSQWTSWASHHIGNDGYIPGVSFDISNTYNGADLSLKLGSSNPCLYSDFWQKSIPVLPDTNYSVWARVKLNDVRGPATSGDYGFVIKQGGWLGTDCNKSGGKLITSFVQGNTDWIEVSGSYKTGSSQLWLDYLYLAMQNTNGGNVYIDEVRVWRTDDPHKVNILREPNANSHMYFDPMNSAMWDKVVEYAEQHGVYLKIVIDEKNEWIRNRLTPDGKISDKAANDNFYAAPGTKSRWLQEAWWRYIIARWGYSPAIFSFEYVNEGDPYNGRHHEAANSMARYFKQNDPNRHMVSTSFWAGFPNKEFWINPKYSDIAYADIHAYISTGWGLYPNHWSSERQESRSEHIRTGNGSAIIRANDSFNERLWIRGMVLQGAGEWIIRYHMKADNFSANCSSGSGGMQRVRWMLDGGSGSSSGREGIVPASPDGSTSRCTSPGGSYDWKQFRSDRDKDGNPLPESVRLIITDNNPHDFWLGIENSRGSSGTAWIDDIEVVSPWGNVLRVVGEFDKTPMDEDTAWYNYAYGNVWGGRSPVGARKPLIRGESGVDFPDRQDWNRDLLKDTDGIWLHNNVWGQMNAGGMYELFWWSSETIPERIYYHFLNFRNFMEDIPLSNGHYVEAVAKTSRSDLRVWGQRDNHNGSMHLWVQNTQHTWKKVINGSSISAIEGNFTIADVPAGSYRVEWWDPYKTSNPIIRTDTISSDGSLRINLPFALSKDLALKIQRLP
jgi:hypothetical protein